MAKAAAQTQSSADSPGAVLITGASSGIGEALAGCFAADGYDLILVARSTDKLQALAAQLADEYGVKAWAESADLAQPGAAADLLARLKRKRRKVDVLVNNAGVLESGGFLAIAPAKHQQIIDLNISGLTAMLSVFVPTMVARGRGRVMNLASIAAFQPIPALASYAASKAYVLSLTESLSEELKGTGVTVTAVCPGITATSMLSSARASNASLNQLPSFVIGDVQQVAAQAYAACMKGQVICVPGALNQAAVLASRSAPKWLVRRLGGVLGRQTL